MNEIIDFLNSHASVRQFTDQPISEEQEKLILTTAQRSPTSSNLHAYSIISIRDQNKKVKLTELTGNQEHVAKSALFLIFCADLYRLARLNKKRGYPYHGDYMEMFIVATVDAALVACRALMTAQAMGMGGVMVGGIRNNPDEVCRLVELPEMTYPVMGMSLGYPVKQPKVKPRLPLEGIAFKEKYDIDKIDKAIDQYDQTLSEVGYLRGRELKPDKFPDFEGTYSWSEHSARRMADDALNVLRGHMKEFLNKRGLALK